jgi:hypothetical protein
MRRISKLEYDHIGIGNPLVNNDEDCYLTEEEADIITSKKFREKVLNRYKFEDKFS